MLKSLYIQNYALIDQLEIEFTNGLSVITGETGAGKSIILGALSLVLGQRADVKSIKHGAAKCTIEAVFDLSSYHLEDFFTDNDLEYDKEYCLIRREVMTNGKSRSFINDTPVSLTQLKDLGTMLIDIHSQHQNLLLGNTHFQLNVIDVVAKSDSLLQKYKQEYKAYNKLDKEHKRLVDEAEKSKQEEDYINFQYTQLSEANLIDGEQEELEVEQEKLTHAEEIKASLYKILQLLDNDESGIVSMLKTAKGYAHQSGKYFAKAEEVESRLESSYIDLKDLMSEIESQIEEVEFNPERLEWVDDRLNLLNSLQQKHRVSSTDQLIELRDQFEKQLQTINSYEDAIVEVEERKEKAYQQVVQTGQQLSRLRQEAAITFENDLVEKVSILGMPNARFNVEFSTRENPEGDGLDQIRFLFSANKNAPLQPVEQTASGGEISRLMLCIKALISGIMALPTIVFDEIDTGVSGEVADKMGDIMKELGYNMQVFTITHLPQVASKGAEHYFVYKEDREDATVTSIRRLSFDERVEELARMLSGSALTDSALANARDLLLRN